MKKRVLREGYRKLFCWVLGLWFLFVATTIESIDLTTYTLYDKILVVWTILALVSFHLLSKYSNTFDN